MKTIAPFGLLALACIAIGCSQRAGEQGAIERTGGERDAAMTSTVEPGDLVFNVEGMT